MSGAHPQPGTAHLGTGTSDDDPGEVIAVVGIAGRFPKARTPEEFWGRLVAGTDCLDELDDQQLLAAGVPGPVLAGPGYVRRSASLDGPDEFDADFFGLPPAVAAAMDPQQRLFLEACWHALEDAGHDPARRDGAVGVFAAPSFSGYFGYNLLSHHDPRTLLGAGTSPALIHALTLTDPNFFATRVAHALDLHGPALTVQTACSSSLVAVHLACQSLLCGETDLALAGGMTVKVPHRVGYLYEPGSMMSADGVCRPFDAAANGTVFGSGGGVVALKRLSDALADGDRVRAVVRGTAVNNDGSLKMGFTAPSVEMQAAVVAEALAVAGVDPHEVGYVEAHGTGTALGDPVEVAALRQALDPSGDRTETCLLGSAKGNIGHLEAASGIAGLIKTVLALEHRTLPGTAHFSAPNPELGLDSGPFEVVAATRAWHGPGPLTAGVSSLGVGGTNAHVVLTQAPAPPYRDEGAAPREAAPVLLVSARDPDALRDAGQRLADALTPESDLADVAHTLAEGRRAFPYRAAVAARTPERAAELLRADHTAAPSPPRPPAPVLLLPGQGTQYLRMSKGLYRHGGTFRRELDRCGELFTAETGHDLRDTLFGDDAAALLRTDVAQPVLFSVEYALARTLQEYGVRPVAVGGHSVGEFAAACLAGVFELGTAVRLVAARGRLMHTAPAGTMLAVRCPHEALADHIAASGLEVAAVNEPGTCVVAGPPAEAAEFAARMTAAGTPVTVLRTAHAFHTAAMEEAAERFAEVAGRAKLCAPAVPLVSNVTGDWMTDGEAVDPRRWARQMRSTVRWSDCVRTLLGDGTSDAPDATGRFLVETGPGRSLASAARRHTAWSQAHRVVSTMRRPEETADDGEALSRALGALWEAGTDIDWSPLRHGRERRVPLPGYPFRRTRHWTEPARTALAASPGASAAVGAPDTGGEPRVTGTADATGPLRAEDVLADVWAEVLGVPRVRPDDNFFDLGGDSTLAARAAALAERRGAAFAPKVLFEHPTVRRLAARIESARPTT